MPFHTRYLALGLLLLGASLQGIVPADVEPRFSAAVLALQSKDYDGSLKALEEVLARYPRLAEALELKGLTLKGQGKAAEAAGVFQELLRKGGGENVDAYRFELGLLHFQQKKYGPARNYLTQTWREGFNIAASRYLLGSMDFHDKRDDRAAAHFTAVLAGDVEDLKPPAHLYLAEVANRQRDPAATIRHYSRARRLAGLRASDGFASVDSRDLAKQVIAAVDKVIANIDRPTFYGSVGLATGYDSNVLFTPSSLASPGEGPSGRGSFRQLLSFEGGYATSPLSQIQLTPLYRGSVNYNFNRSLKAGEYFINELSLYAAYRALDPTSYGLRLSLLGTFRNTLDPATGLQRYRTYNLLGVVGPYVRVPLGGRWSLIATVMLVPQRYFLDSETAFQFHRSGADYLAEITLRQERERVNWNPALTLRGNSRYTKGPEFRNRGLELELSNRFHLSDRLTLTGYTTLASYSYPDRPDGRRFDVALSLGTSAEYRLNGPLQLFASLELLRNESNAALPYEFTRYLFNAGATYRF